MGGGHQFMKDAAGPGGAAAGAVGAPQPAGQARKPSLIRIEIVPAGARPAQREPTKAAE